MSARPRTKFVPPAVGLLRLAFFLATMLLAACHGPGRVEFTNGECLIDSAPATLSQVEAQQAFVTQHMLSRQPLLVLVTVLVVVLGGMSHVEKLILLFSTRGAHAKGLGDRIRAMLDRYRAHPVRYFSIVASTLGLLVLSGGMYIYLDADKRTSERALAMLQFCHITLRNLEEQKALEEQRRNLESIQATAGNIRTLVDKLPPEEKRKAKEIVDQLSSALGREAKLVGSYVERADESERILKEHAKFVEHGLSNLEASVVNLKSVPASVHDLLDSFRQMDARLTALQAKLDACAGKEDAALQTLAQLRDRPIPVCPACICGKRTSTSSAASKAAESSEKR